MRGVPKSGPVARAGERIEPVVQDLSKFKIPNGFRGRSEIVVQLWWVVQATVFACSPQFMYGWRNWLLRLFGARIGRDVLVRPSVRVTYPWKLTIGDRSWIGDFTELYTLAHIVIGSDAVVSQYSYLCTGSHDYRSVAFDIYAKPIVIEDQAWIAAGSFIHPGVTVKKGAVVGARSMLTVDAGEFGIYIGQPARRVGSRDPSHQP